jgi:hypothetical protein
LFTIFLSFLNFSFPSFLFLSFFLSIVSLNISPLPQVFSSLQMKTPKS